MNVSPLFRGRKAFEIQFNWIFVIIVGAIILAFFITIVLRQRDVSSNRETVTILDNLEQNLVSQKVSENRQDVIRSRSPFLVGFSCDDLSVNDQRRGMGNAVMFGPSSVTASEIFTLSHPWELGFSITNFLYLSTPETLYYLIGDSVSTSKLKERLHDALTIKEATGVDDVEFNNEQTVRLIFVNYGDPPILTMPSALEDVEDSRITALAIDDIDRPLGAALTFYKKDGNDFVKEELNSLSITNPYPSLGSAAMIGAVYSDTLEQYACSMKNAAQRLAFVASINAVRSANLEAYYSGTRNDLCAAYHGSEPFMTLSEEVISVTEGSGESAGVISAVNDLNNHNDQATLASCARLY